MDSDTLDILIKYVIKQKRALNLILDNDEFYDNSILLEANGKKIAYDDILEKLLEIKEKANANENTYTLEEIAIMSNITLRQAIEEVCECEFLFGKPCEYHKNTNAKYTLSQWKEMSLTYVGCSKFVEDGSKLSLKQK